MLPPRCELTCASSCSLSPHPFALTVKFPMHSKTWNQRLPLYLQPRMLTLLMLGFSSGLPLMLTGSTLLAWLQSSGIRTAEIGLFSLVGLPYSCKVLWAPLIDRFELLPQQLGKRRGWLLTTQVGLGAAFLLLARTSPQHAPLQTAALALLVAFLSATQDIAVDAYRTDLLTAKEAAAGTATFVLGYRLAMILSGALALRWADTLPGHFSTVYALMALALVPGFLISLRAQSLPAMHQQRQPKATLKQELSATLVAPWRDFFQRRGAVLLLLLVMTYRLTDSLSSSLLTPFLLQTGFTNTQIADATKLVGLIASIIGALLGGAVVARVGLARSLLVFGLLQAATNLGYVQLVGTGPALTMLYVVVGIDQLCSGLAVAASGALLIRLCNRRYSATQAALLSSASGVLGRVLSGGSGFFVERFGWSTFLYVTALLGIPALLLLRYVTLPQAELDADK